jgi:hypothetical protein
VQQEEEVKARGVVVLNPYVAERPVVETFSAVIFDIVELVENGVYLSC